MDSFYKYLTKDPTISKAEALQRAQDDLRKTEEWSDPTYWAPFTLIGNWLSPAENARVNREFRNR